MKIVIKMPQINYFNVIKLLFHELDDSMRYESDVIEEVELKNYIMGMYYILI